MWYNENDDELDYNRPIIAIDENNEKYIFLLLPQIEKNNHYISGAGLGYKKAGYNWFNIKTGKYNSQMFWEHPKDAVSSYMGKYTIKNADISIK